MRTSPFHASRQLLVDKLYDDTERCPACYSTAAREAKYFVQKDPEVAMLECRQCGLYSSSRKPLPEVLDEYYATFYSDPDDQVTLTNKNKFARHIFHYAAAVAPSERLCVLDFGGGDGTLALLIARVALESGYDAVDVQLVDYTKPATSPDNRITISGVQHLDEVSGHYDLVLASAILEHIPELGEVMSHLFSHVDQGGVFYARTPYMAPFARYVRNLDFNFPGHVHDMGPRFWNGVVNMLSLEAQILASQPSIVETTFRDHFVRTLTAHLLKLPSHIEVRLRSPGSRRMLWHFVGGWEIFLKFRSPSKALT